MDSREQNIIRLAEFRRWRRVPDQDGAVIDLWTSPEHPVTAGTFAKYYRIHELPNPYESDADCMAVVQKIIDHGFNVSILFFSDGQGLVQLVDKESGTRLEGGDYDNYRDGVCELALLEAIRQ